MEGIGLGELLCVNAAELLTQAQCDLQTVTQIVDIIANSNVAAMRRDAELCGLLLGVVEEGKRIGAVLGSVISDGEGVSWH